MEKIRLLVLFQGNTLNDHPGYHDGFQKLQDEFILDAYCTIPYYGFTKEHGWEELWVEAERIIRLNCINAVFLHFFHDQNIPDPTKGIKRILACPSNPTIFTSLGDPYNILLNPVPDSYKQSSILSDINFMTSMGRLANGLARQGTKNLIFMPHGVCQKRFSSSLDKENYNPDFDVVFVGSRILSRYIIGSSSWYGFWRDKLVNLMTKRFGSRFALFGLNWAGNPSWRGPVPYDSQNETVRRSRVQIGGYPNSTNDYYTSDREFIALASGIPFVDYFVPGVECMFKDGKDWWLGKNFGEMLKHIENLLNISDNKRLEIGDRVRNEILAHHTQYHRCQQMIEIVSNYRDQKLAGNKADLPVLPYLRYKLSKDSGCCPAIINWQG